MLRHSSWAVLALAAGLATAQAADPVQHGLVHGIFKPAAEAAPENVIHPLEPAQRLEALTGGTTFQVGALAQGAAESMAFPVLAAPGAKEPTALPALAADGTFLAALDLTGSGVSDLIYGGRDTGGWKVLSNGARLPTPVQGFVAGHFPKGADKAGADGIP